MTAAADIDWEPQTARLALQLVHNARALETVYAELVGRKCDTPGCGCEWNGKFDFMGRRLGNVCEGMPWQERGLAALHDWDLPHDDAKRCPPGCPALEVAIPGPSDLAGVDASPHPADTAAPTVPLGEAPAGSEAYQHPYQEDHDGEPATQAAQIRWPRPQADDTGGTPAAHAETDRPVPPQREPEDTAPTEAERPADLPALTGRHREPELPDLPDDDETLAVFHAVNAEHLVPAHEPDPSGTDPALAGVGGTAVTVPEDNTPGPDSEERAPKGTAPNSSTGPGTKRESDEATYNDPVNVQRSQPPGPRQQPARATRQGTPGPGGHHQRTRSRGGRRSR